MQRYRSVVVPMMCRVPQGELKQGTFLPPRILEVGTVSIIGRLLQLEV
jgi:hypothetical protein